MIRSLAELDPRPDTKALIGMWRELVPCSCSRVNHAAFGDCISCSIGCSILDERDAEEFTDLMNAIRAGTASYLEGKMQHIPFVDRKLRCTLAEMSHDLKRALKVPTQ